MQKKAHKKIANQQGFGLVYVCTRAKRLKISTWVSPKWVKSNERKEQEEERKRILQGLGVGPGSATERWPSQKIARKWPFFLGGEKIT